MLNATLETLNHVQPILIFSYFYSMHIGSSAASHGMIRTSGDWLTHMLGSVQYPTSAAVVAAATLIDGHQDLNSWSVVLCVRN